MRITLVLEISSGAKLITNIQQTPQFFITLFRKKCDSPANIAISQKKQKLLEE
jgi:hypothetical protein